MKHKDIYVREASAWALWQLSRFKHDIGSAVPALVWLLTDADDYEEPRKNAVGALLNHAKKSADNAEQVRESVKTVTLDPARKEIKRFLDQLTKLKAPSGRSVTQRGRSS